MLQDIPTVDLLPALCMPFFRLVIDDGDDGDDSSSLGCCILNTVAHILLVFGEG